MVEAWLWRQVLAELAPAGERGRLTVLGFHQVLADPDPLRPDEPSASRFESQLRWISSWFNVLPLAEAVSRLKARELPERALCVTFDDGYANNHDVALPILRKLGVPATFFIASGYLDGGRMFNDTILEAVRQAPGPALDLEDLGLGRHPLGSPEARCRALHRILGEVKYLVPSRRSALAEEIARRTGARLPDDLMMTSSQVKALHKAGMEIGAHTHTHPILAELSLDEARNEIIIGRQRLERITGAPVRSFAYPNGRPQRDYRREHADLVRGLGFAAAVSTAWGAARGSDDEYQLPRFTPWDRSRWGFALRLSRNLTTQRLACA